MKQFKFSDAQAQAILDMKLQRLAGLERKKIEDELKEIQDLIKELKDILSSEKKMLKIIKDELIEIGEKYGDERRTKVIKYKAKEFNPEDLIAEKEAVLIYTAGGYVKRTDPDEFRTQMRGGVGVVDMNTKEEDFITISLTTSTHSDLLFFTNKGKVYQIKMYDIPEGRRATRGKSIMNYLQISGDEKVTSILPMPKDIKNSTVSLAMITMEGTIKKSSAESFKDVRRSGLIAIKLDEKDVLLSALFVEAGDDIILTSINGQSIRFAESDVREMGRTAGGVRGMKLDKNDHIASCDVIKKDFAKKSKLLVVTENGYGKMTKLEEYKTQGRGGSGIKTVSVTEKTGKLIVAKVIVDEEAEVLAVSKNSQVIKTEINKNEHLERSYYSVVS
jgi:DNA gyrase subunit A